MQKKFPELNLRLMSAGLGSVFKRTIEGTALLVPSATALESAGEDWNSETLPVFTCLAMSKPAGDNSGVETLPFFLDPSDAQANLKNAIDKSRDRLTEAQVRMCPHMNTIAHKGT